MNNKDKKLPLDGSEFTIQIKEPEWMKSNRPKAEKKLDGGLKEIYNQPISETAESQSKSKQKKLDRLSIFLSLVLRHKPEAANVKMDEHGYVDVEELIAGAQAVGRDLDLEKLRTIVLTDRKNRYSFSEDLKKIRANQGHSLEVDLGLKETTPPDTLFHGTSMFSAGEILYNGISKMSRQHVHLTDDIDTAKRVGLRHGSPIVLEVNARRMVADGYKFYLSENGVWLTDNVPCKYVSI